MSNPLDDVSGSGLLRFTDPTSRNTEGAGNTAREVDEGITDISKQPSPDRGNGLSTGATDPRRAAEKQLQDVPVTDATKVEKIKRRITDGSFKIDAGRVAAKLLASDAWLD